LCQQQKIQPYVCIISFWKEQKVHFFINKNIFSLCISTTMIDKAKNQTKFLSLYIDSKEFFVSWALIIVDDDKQSGKIWGSKGKHLWKEKCNVTITNCFQDGVLK